MNNSEQVMKIIGQLITQDSKDDNEKQWLKQHAPNPAIAEHINSLTTRDMNVIAAVNKSHRIYAKQLPELLHLSQPTISRAIKKLNERAVIKRYSTPQNTKDIILELTPSGLEIAKVQIKLRKQIQAKISAIMAELSKSEAEQFITTLTKIKNMDIFN
ncbi:MarR family winged helix-turn-helix transcriptional regulator [Lactobacillus sp. Sy-1]|uniref:MarR family winged helix-turn-helix transcriptional regulator n=1 Tax=Lactobacillus sp. Sy-1 TaxID=2109645 RepID=UPI001C5AAB21|nr:MarR family winged helix-turn-helix transcriptional regulator [Lactobacillus sp. Sy-1]MBW1605880.1 winged helix-turn-helix transcriptional regulator [Lactobacillus sp. Sy-1]